MDQEDTIILNTNTNGGNLPSNNNNSVGRHKRSGSMRRSLLVMSTPPSMKRYDSSSNVLHNTSNISDIPERNSPIYNASQQQQQQQQQQQHYVDVALPERQSSSSFKSPEQMSSNDSQIVSYERNPELNNSQIYDNSFNENITLSPQIESQQQTIQILKNQHFGANRIPQQQDNGESDVVLSLPEINNNNNFRHFTPTPLNDADINPNSSTPPTTVKNPMIRRSGSTKKRMSLSLHHGTESAPDLSSTNTHRRLRSLSIPSPIGHKNALSPEILPPLEKDNRLDFENNNKNNNFKFGHTRTPSPVRPTSDEIFKLLASKESEILTTKNQIEEIKKILKSKEIELLNQYKQLEVLKQNMSMELIKSHNDEQDSILSSSENLSLGKDTYLDETMNRSNRLSFSGASQSFGSNIPTASISSGSGNATSNVLNVRKKPSKLVSQDDALQADFEERVGKQVISNSTSSSSAYHSHSLHDDVPASTVEEFDTKAGMIRTNTTNKDDTIYEESDPDDVVINNESVLRRNNTVNRNKRASRVSMYFSKGMSLLNQFDQILQNELEKKLGLDDPPAESLGASAKNKNMDRQGAEILDSDADPNEVNQHPHLLPDEAIVPSTEQSEQSTQSTQSSERRTGYKYFFA